MSILLQEFIVFLVTPLLVDNGSAVTLVHCCVLVKAKIHIKLKMVSEPVVSANGQLLDIKGKSELEIFLVG